MMRDVAKLHISALPHTWSSRHGLQFVMFLYMIVGKIGFVKLAHRKGELVGAISGIGKLILTLVVSPKWQRGGVGRELIEGLSGNLYVYTEDCSVGFYEKMRFVRIGKYGKMIFLCRKC